MRGTVAKRLREEAGWVVGRNGMKKHKTFGETKDDQFLMESTSRRYYKSLKKKHNQNGTPLQ